MVGTVAVAVVGTVVVAVALVVAVEVAVVGTVAALRDGRTRSPYNVGGPSHRWPMAAAATAAAAARGCTTTRLKVPTHLRKNCCRY